MAGSRFNYLRTS